jgi:hypothetical protein
MHIAASRQQALGFMLASERSGKDVGSGTCGTMRMCHRAFWRIASPLDSRHAEQMQTARARLLRCIYRPGVEQRQLRANLASRQQMLDRDGGFSIGLDYLLWFPPTISEQCAGSLDALLRICQRQHQRLQRFFGELTASRFDASRSPSGITGRAFREWPTRASATFTLCYGAALSHGKRLLQAGCGTQAR